MPKARKVWMNRPPKKSKPSVPELIKEATTAMALNVIENILKPKYALPPPAEERFNYLTNFSGKWHRSYFYFISHYACPGPNAISPTFESKFARMEYVGEGKFALSYHRHTGAWYEIYPSLSVTECLQAIQDDPIFQP
jgi:hypothetical protein